MWGDSTWGSAWLTWLMLSSLVNDLSRDYFNFVIHIYIYSLYKLSSTYIFKVDAWKLKGQGARGSPYDDYDCRLQAAAGVYDWSQLIPGRYIDQQTLI